MDKDPEQLERELALLRSRTDLLAQELERRLRELTDVRLQARRHPVMAYLLGAAAFSILAVVLRNRIARLLP